MEDEVFGPILPVLTYRTLDEVFGRIAATPHPLAAFIFSREQKTIDRFIGELSFGGGAVNQVNIHLFVETMPFGGVGPSGMGHYYGKYGFDMLTHAKSMLVSRLDVAIDHLFPPYTPEKNAAPHSGSNIDSDEGASRSFRAGLSSGSPDKGFTEVQARQHVNESARGCL
jgi:aldehyde dehydrogenase (NAD+)